MATKVYKINLEVLTPTHVGVGMENKLLKGLDFSVADKKYNIFNPDSLYKNLSQQHISSVTSHLASGDFVALERYLSTNKLITQADFQYKWPSQYLGAQEIRKSMQDGAGKYIIPGSSIKGSLRSVIATTIYKEQGGNGNRPISETELFGKIDNNLMRYLTVTDCTFNDTIKNGIFPVKIFSADINQNEKYGAWKDQRTGGHSESFSSNGFVTYYEMLLDEMSAGGDYNKAVSDFRISWGGADLILEKRRGQVPNLDKFATKDITWLWSSIKKHTDSFIKKEIEFFDEYPNESLADESFFDELQWLQEENLKDDNSVLLRVGANVGWHSITGDWKYDDFSRATESNRRERNSYKTRKIGFDRADYESPIRYFLPGFVKVTLQ